VSTAEHAETNRRDFLYIATGAVGAVGAALTAWPFINQMNPDASVRALASVEIDLAPIAEGQEITIKWRGNPVFIRHRLPSEIEAAKRLVLPLPRLALRHRRPHPQRARARQPAGSALRLSLRHQDPHRLRRTILMSGHSNYQPKSAFGKWMHERLPIMELVQGQALDFPHAEEPQLLVDLRRHPRRSC
jgi:hypothetical protein